METRSEIEVKLSDKVKVFFTTRVDGFSKGIFIKQSGTARS